MQPVKSCRVDAEAWAEFEAAADWYQVRSVDASIEFTRDVLDAFDKICQSPLRWPEYLHGTRRFILRRFPFAIVYLDEKDTVDIVAIAHTSRKPGYWRHRL